MFPDGVGLPARDPACADQEQACVMKETCTASLCIASRWSATRWYHQPTKARQPPTACNGCGHWQGEAAATGGCNGAELFSGKYSRRPGFCSTKFSTSFLRKHRSPSYNPKRKIPSLKGIFFPFRLYETRQQNPEYYEYLPGDPSHEQPQPVAYCSRLWSPATGQWDGTVSQYGMPDHSSMEMETHAIDGGQNARRNSDRDFSIACLGRPPGLKLSLGGVPLTRCLVFPGGARGKPMPESITPRPSNEPKHCESKSSGRDAIRAVLCCSQSKTALAEFSWSKGRLRNASAPPRTRLSKSAGPVRPW